MTLLHEAVDAKKMDVRVVGRHIERGVVRPEEVEKSVKGLPDDAENATWVSIEDIARQEDTDKSSLNGLGSHAH